MPFSGLNSDGNESKPPFHLRMLGVDQFSSGTLSRKVTLGTVLQLLCKSSEYNYGFLRSGLIMNYFTGFERVPSCKEEFIIKSS